MTFQVKTLVEDIEVKGPFSNKKTGSEFDAHILKTKNGEFTQYVTKDKTPSVAKGDEVEIFYDESKGFKGTFNKVVKLIKLEASVKSKPIDKPKTVTAQASVGHKATTEQKPHALNTLPSKDISMEVSGLLQALLTRGVPQEELEIALREVLNLKRRIAQELELKGSV